MGVFDATNIARSLEDAERQAVAGVRARDAASDMLTALLNVRALISEAAMTGFNCNDGDWAERLFVSQRVTTEAINKARGTGPVPLDNQQNAQEK